MPEFAMPNGACDCHMHIFGPADRYPPAPVRAYTPTPATLAQYETVASSLGLSRVVFVQPSGYGTDNSCMMDALAARAGNSRGVAVIDESHDDQALDRMNHAGVRGIRLNLVSSGEPDPDGASQMLRWAAARVERLGWHVQIFARPSLWRAILPTLSRLHVPVVIDHMGALDASKGTEAPGLAELTDLLANGHAWVKLSGANRISAAASGFEDALPIMRALLAANPERCVWGTDWPHIGPHDISKGNAGVIYLPLDNPGLLALLVQAAAGDAGLLSRVLAANPARLYGF